MPRAPIVTLTLSLHCASVQRHYVKEKDHQMDEVDHKLETHKVVYLLFFHIAAAGGA